MGHLLNGWTISSELSEHRVELRLEHPLSAGLLFDAPHDGTCTPETVVKLFVLPALHSMSELHVIAEAPSETNADLVSGLRVLFRQTALDKAGVAALVDVLWDCGFVSDDERRWLPRLRDALV